VNFVGIFKSALMSFQSSMLKPVNFPPSCITKGGTILVATLISDEGELAAKDEDEIAVTNISNAMSNANIEYFLKRILVI
jgi:hypothetical protein